MALMGDLKRVVPMLLTLVAIGGLSACGGSDESSSSTGYSITENSNGAESTAAQEPATTTIVVKDGEPVGGVQELEYSAGEEVRFTVRSDVADEVHVHGYDVEKEIPAGGSAALSFPADIEGIFEVELHESDRQIAELRVNP
jgi:hypothetical protein